MKLKNNKKMNKKFLKDKQGFTLLELLVSIGIMAVLLGLFFVNFKKVDYNRTLNNEQEQVVSILKQAQIYALVGQTIDNQRYNYGVHVEECSAGECQIIIFKDLKTGGDKIYTLGEEILTQNLARDISIQDGGILLDSSPVSDSLDIVFEVPLAKIYFNTADSASQAEINLYHVVTQSESGITINRVSGQIE